MTSLAPEIAVMIPCHNEEATIGKVVDDFRAALPEATLFVCDNCSSDQTAEVARRHGAVVRFEDRKGKGNAVRRMFADVEADVYVMVDGDDTYDAGSARAMVDELLAQSVDMVNAVRQHTSDDAYRSGHQLGNKLLTSLVARIFGNRSKDMLSGYRVMSRRFVKTFPALSSGFEIETELTVHALQLRCPTIEFASPYKERPPGSMSKLSTFKDGLRILNTISILVREEMPLQFFSVVGLSFVLVGAYLGIPVINEFFDTGLVPRFPTAVLAAALMLLAALSLCCGLILSTVTRSRNELKRLNYLQHSVRYPRRQA